MTASDKPVIKADAMYQLLRERKIDAFNALRTQGTSCDLHGSDLRGLDLRGVDLSASNLEGASISGAKISGAYFPIEWDAEEITLSPLHGTRMRYRCKPRASAAKHDA